MGATPRIIDFRTPASGFDQPLALWQACHERVARMNNMLERLVEHLKKNPVDEAAGITATSVRRYFDEAAPRHHEDEEIDLFPRLLAKLHKRDSATAAQTEAAVRTLLADHADMHALWTAIREQLLRIEAGRAPQFDDAQVTLFVTRYRMHIAIEDQQIAPALRRLLKTRDLQEIGSSMAARRGVDWSELAAK